MISKDTKIKIEGIPEGFTERIHSGSTGEWRRPGQSHHDGKEIIIEAPEKGMKSELVDGEWYWVCGCSKCLGTDEIFPYWVCDEHNVCVTCGIHRRDLTDVPWGTAGGFRCKPCQERLDKEELIEALEKMPAEEDYDDWDYYGTDEVKCPHCDLEYYDIHESTRMTCERCKGEFDIEIEYLPHIQTKVIGERITLEKVLKGE